MKLAIVGCGAQGTALAEAAANLGHEVILCADPIEARARRLARAHGARFSARVRDAFKTRQAEAVVIGSPTDEHASQIAQAAKAGLHVYCAAPLALEVKRARAALEAVRESGTTCYVAHDSRVDPALGNARQQVAGGAIGEVGFVRVRRACPLPDGSRKWYRDYARSQGALGHVVVQDIAWVIEQFGPAEKVFAQALMKPRVDYAMTTLTLKDGPIVQLIGSWANPPETSASVDIEFCGSEGMVMCQTPGAPLEILQRSGEQAPKAESPLAESIEARHLSAFSEAVENRAAKVLRSDLELRIVRIVEAGATSARTGKPVRP